MNDILKSVSVLDESGILKVEALEPIKSDGYILNTGDRVTVSMNTGHRWVKHGWAKDLSGLYETGERKVVKATIQPFDVSHIKKNLGLG